MISVIFTCARRNDRCEFNSAVPNRKGAIATYPFHSGLIMPRTQKPVGFYTELAGKKNTEKKKEVTKKKKQQVYVKDPCIVCRCNVDDNERALCCDICLHWQHVACGTQGVSAEDYDRAVQGETSFIFRFF